jgi:hypothetical protein
MLKSLTPKQKQIAVALAGTAVLAIIALLGRRNSAAPATDATTDPQAGAAAPFGSTFADNGEAAGGLSTAITDGLGNVALGLDSVSAQQSTVAESLNALAAQRQADSAAIEQALNNFQIPTPAVAAPAAAAQAATARTTRPAPAKPAGVFTQTKGTRAGRNYKLVVSRGQNIRLYESAPGRKDYGKKPNTRIPAGANTKAAAKTKPKPKPAPKPKAKAKATAPSKRPAHQPKTPARKRRR